MDLDDFLARLRHLDAGQLQSLAATTRSRAETVDSMIVGWKATALIDRAIRGKHLSYTATMASSRASAAVLASADEALMSRRDPDVVLVARAAREIARGLVGGPAVHSAVTDLATLNGYQLTA